MNDHQQLARANLFNRDEIFAMERLGKSLQFIDLKDADKVDFAQVELKVEHNFSLGIYARTLYIPKGAVVVGKLHKYPQLNILAKGDISVSVDDEVKRIQAVQVISSPAGVKRIAYTHEDTVWITVHATEETNLNLIEDHFIAQSEQDYLDFISNDRKQISTD